MMNRTRKRNLQAVFKGAEQRLAPHNTERLRRGEPVSVLALALPPAPAL